jgi:iron complex outermembrane receptor protein
LNNTYSASANLQFKSGGDTHSGGIVSGTCDYVDPSSNFHVKHYAELGLNFGYVSPWGTEFGIGIQNVTDAAPAYDRNATWPWYSQQTYSNMGRFVYGTVAHKFN